MKKAWSVFGCGSVLIVLLTVWVYLPVRYCGFVNMDDDVYVTANPRPIA